MLGLSFADWLRHAAVYGMGGEGREQTEAGIGSFRLSMERYRIDLSPFGGIDRPN